jgi:hypothetical protein
MEAIIVEGKRRLREHIDMNRSLHMFLVCLLV